MWHTDIRGGGEHLYTQNNEVYVFQKPRTPERMLVQSLEFGASSFREHFHKHRCTPYF